jgi:hypothetical protein
VNSNNGGLVGAEEMSVGGVVWGEATHTPPSATPASFPVQQRNCRRDGASLVFLHLSG